MSNRLNKGLRDVDSRLILIATGTLLVCLLYNFLHAFRSLDPGFVIDGDWTVIIDDPCDLTPDWCGANEDLIESEDKIVMMGELSFADSQADKRVSAFAGLEPGDSVPITIERNGETHMVDWLIPPQVFSHQLTLFISTFLIYMPFWLVGTYVLLFIQPRDTRWRLFVAFNYVTALWLAMGLTSATRVAWSALAVSALSWLLVPVYLHFHLQMPRPLRGRSWRIILIPLYLATIALITLELLQILPFRAYLWGLIVALFGSIIILLFHLFSNRSQAERLATRIMLIGIVLAFGPGFLFWLLPRVMSADSPGQQSISIAILAIPVLPLFYAYAIYKRRLGMRESTANRALNLYAAFLLYLTVLVAALLLSSIWTETSNTLPTLGLAILLAIFLTSLSFGGGLRKIANKVAYGTAYEPNEIRRVFASKIPAATNRETLVQLLADEIAPTLFIRQSAMLLELEEGFSCLYERGVNLGDAAASADSFRLLLSQSGRYIPESVDGLAALSDAFGWVRLIVPVSTGTRTNGAWLFGERDPDNFYSQSDIDLLISLANQVAIAIENGNLLNALRRELNEKRQVQAALQIHAERLGLLREIDKAILVVESGADIARAALARTMQLIPCQHASVILFDFDTEEMEVLALQSADETELHTGQRSHLRFPASAAPLLEGKLWVVDDVNQLSEKSQVESVHGHGVRSFVSAPIMESDVLLGALSVAAKNKDALTAEHAEIVMEVSNSVAVALTNARLVDAVKKHSRDLQQLSSRLITAQETERQRISYELHDEIGQMLTGITLNLASIQNNLPESASPEIYEKLADTTTLLAKIMDQVRQLSGDLRPAMLRDLGLVPTLRWYINKQANRYDLRIDFESNEVNGRLPPGMETAMFRVVQEALTNVARHAAASRVGILLECTGTVIRVIIEDNGRGFDMGKVFSPDSTSQGTGLVGMRERVSSLNGKLEIVSETGHGTKVKVELPMENERDPDSHHSG
jgi:signal transduction histidine kinase